MELKYLLVGGGLVSSQAAKIIRMKDTEGSIGIVAKEPHLPYDRPPLSKEFLRGGKSVQEVFYDDAPFFAGKRIEVFSGDPAVTLDIDAKSVTLASGRRIAFDKVLLATGAEPLRLDVPGAEGDGVYYLRTLDDAGAIAAAAGDGRRAVVIGAGFIGMELAASLTTLGCRVTVVEAEQHVWPRFIDPGLAGFVQRYCEERGVAFRLGERVTAIERDKTALNLATSAGVLVCDFVCIGIGVTPEVGLARDAGLDIDNGIVVNEYLQTSHPDVYAGGDAVNYPDPIFGRRRVEHWGHAEYCGQLAGLNMTGAQQAYDLLSYVWSDVFDLHIEFAGDEAGFDRALVRGKPDAPPFTVLYFKRNILNAYLAINTSSGEFPKLQRLIRGRVDLTGRDADLSNPSFELKGLL